MRKNILPLVIGLLSLASLTVHAVNDIEPGKEYYSVLKAPNPIVLDGNLSEWTGIPVLADPRFYIRNGPGGTPLEGQAAGKGSGGTNATLVLFEQYNGGTWTGPDDHTSAVQITYDADNVYFGFVVTDDYHENAANSAWNGDSVQLMIASSDRSTQVALYNYALGGTETALGSVIVEHEAGPGGTEAVITRNTATKKTTYEIKLPKASLGLTNLIAGPTEPLVTFGLGMAINDGDELTPGQKGWGGLGAHAIVFGKTPSETALMTLVRPNDIEPGKQAYTAAPLPGAFTLDGILSEWTGVPVLADPRFYIRNGPGGAPLEGQAAGKGSGGTNATLFLFERYNGGDWTGPDDQTSAVQIAFDADNVYFGFVVTDEYHEDAANSAWNGDSVQLMIANSNLTTQVALYNYALGGTEGAIGSSIVEHEAGPGGTAAIVTRNAATHKTSYEIKLPATALGLTAPLKFGDRFGLGMAINDGDQATPGQKGWGGLGAHAIVFGKTPSETAFVTLGIANATADRLFFSAIVQTLTSFSFRANDNGPSIIDPATARLIIDGVTNTPTASARVLDHIDFSFTPANPFGPGDHNYVIVMRDTLGNTVTSQASFNTPYYPLLVPADKVTPNLAQLGYIWNVHQNGDFLSNSIDRALQQLAGLLGQNFADPDAQSLSPTRGVAGPTPNHPISFQIDGDGGLINLGQPGSAGGEFSDFEMPGIPGLGPFASSTDGIAAELITFVDLAAGWHTNVIYSEDNFRLIGGNINDIFRGKFVGEYNDPAGRPGGDTTFAYFVQQAGVYPFRLIFEAGANGASVEWKKLLSDGTRILLDDVPAGGNHVYHHLAAGSALPTGISMVSPLPGGTAPANTRIFASIQEGATTVDLASVRLKFDTGAPFVVSATRAGSVVSVNHLPVPPLLGGPHTATLSYTAGGIARTQSWSFTIQGTQIIWMVGLDDDAWPAGDGGGPNASFVQENGAIQPLPGSPTSPEINQQADNDYYFAGSYTTVIPSVTARYGAYAPVGAVAVNEEAAERAFAGGDLDLRYHFNLPATLQPTDFLSVSFDANNLDVNPADGTVPPPTDPRFGVEVYFNGVLVQTQIVIRPAQLGVDFTTPAFSLASVNAQVGPGFDNIVSLKGVTYLAEGGGNWMGIDYVQLNPAAAPAGGTTITIRRSGVQVTITWGGGGTLQETATLPSAGAPVWAPVAGNPTSPYTFTPAAVGNKFYRVAQ